MVDKAVITSFFQLLQDTICRGIEELDGKSKFSEDNWIRQGGGGGCTRIIQNGNVFEKGGVNFSEVYGEAPSFLTKEINDSKNGYKNFFATGVSVVIHPSSPIVPIIHMNVRYLEMTSSADPSIPIEQWFGGGIDLTPVYINEKDAQFFHLQLKKTCDKFDSSYYSEFKKWADDYFFISHRKETRGIGGIFFDRLVPNEEFSLDERFEFVKAIGETFLPVYSEIVKSKNQKNFDKAMKQWQLIRRGRYAEFNLVYDRGTKFGLKTDGRAESILMSLPPLASWIYNYVPLAGSEEEKTQKLLRRGIDWTQYRPNSESVDS